MEKPVTILERPKKVKNGESIILRKYTMYTNWMIKSEDDFNAILGVPFNAVFDDGDDGGEGGTDGGSEGGADGGIDGGSDGGSAGSEGEQGGAGSTDGSTFTQDQVNSMLAEQKRKMQKTVNDQVKKIENLSKTANLTKEEKDNLAKQVSTIKTTLETEKQRAAREKAEQKNQFDQQVSELTAERDRYKGLYEGSTIKRSISDAASANKAINNAQVMAILEPNTSLIEDIDDDGIGLGTYKPVVKFADKDKEGNSVQVQYTPAEAVKRMTELSDFANLFESTNKGGAGKTNEGESGKATDLKSAANSNEDWAENRKKFGLK